MITAKVIRPFKSEGQIIEAGTVIRFPEESLPALVGLVEVVELTEAEQLMQLNASDFVRFCLNHEATMPGGRCPVKNDRWDPMTGCLGWQLKTSKDLH